MRKKYFLLLLFSVFIHNSYGQGSPTCANANPFCASSSGSSLTFPNTTGAGSPGGGVNYSCLETQPNPAWFYLQIKQAGDLNFVISQTADASAGGGGLDVDFIAWGPFLSPLCGPANLNSSTEIDCSYSTAPTESFSINDALVGEYYMVLITNFGDKPGKIKLTQLGSSTGSTNCDIVCPLSITGGDVPICKNPVLTALYVNSVNPTFQWYFNGAQISGATQISYTPTLPGTYAIVANSPGCGVNQTVSVVVPENPQIPIEEPRNPLLACTFAAFDLTVNTAIILSGLPASNYVVDYHRTLFDAQNAVLPIILPNSYFGTNGETIYVSIHDLVNPNCITVTQFKLKTLPCGPIPIKPADLSVCDDISNNGVETFDLSQQYETIIGANNPTKFTTTFHTSLSDADNDTNPITSVSAYQNIENPQIIYVRLEENTNQLNYGTTNFKLIVNPIATVSIIGSTICAPIKAEPNIPGTYSYEWTVPDGVNSPGNVAIFTTTLPGIYSVVVTNTVTNCVSEIASGVVSDSTFPTVTVTSSVVCSESLATVTAVPGSPGTYTYDWIILPSGVPNPGNVASFTTLIAGTYKVKITNAISSCVSANGIGSVSHIPLPTVTVNSQRICQGGTATVVATPGIASGNYVYIWTVPAGVIPPGSTPSFNTTVGGTYSVVIKDISTNCYSHSASGDVVVRQLPGVIPNVITPTICSGQTTNVELPITMSGTEFTWTVYATGVSGATDGTGEFIAQTLFTTGNITGTVVYTITPKVNGCEGRTSIVTIYVTPIPLATATPINQTICSETKTFIELTSSVVGTVFNWTVVQNRVRGAIGGTGNTIEQLLTSTSTTPGDVIYTIYPIFGNCQGNPITVTITVSPKPEIFGFTSTTICDATSTNIDLSPNLPETTLEWTVVQSNVTGASSGSGLSIDQVLTLTGNVNGTATYTVTPTSNGCVGKPIDIVVTVKAIPTPEISGGLICVDEVTDIASQTFTIETGLNESVYEFKWYFNDILIDDANNSYYEASQSGIYGVTATDIATGCLSNVFYATVTDAFVGQSVTATLTEAFSENPTVTVQVIGGNVEFVYQLDNGTPQSSNVFSPVSLGTHTINVTDVNNCTSLSTEIFVIGYPHYFTPNGDGINDTWNVVGYDDQPSAKIFIYDRFGKLIKQIFTTGEGWDGTYNGNLMPSTDYWFAIEYVENGINKVFKSHFALKIN